eukprot:TRINITY_DN9412_c0_g4_i1.p1 TRINITY_DN9412_c0_g4~~TRINITY_DN9412_c0_g4_i1.p1  ORF type:complete len:375 (-),score=73.24 TRINITY_DN9412_c0_g4_i1:121-1245(-)
MATCLPVRWRKKIANDVWPIDICIKALGHPSLLVREESVKTLTQFAEFDELKELVVSRVPVDRVVDETIDRARSSYTPDDLYYHALIAQLLDTQPVQEEVIKKGYVDVLVDNLHQEDQLLYSLATISLGKLTSHEKANLLIAETDTFYKLFCLVYNPKTSVEIHVSAPHMNYLFLESLLNTKLALLNLYKGPHREKALASVPLLDREKVDDVLQSMLASHSPSKDRFWTLANVFALNSLIPTVTFGIMWGFTRTFISNRLISSEPVSLREFKVAGISCLKNTVTCSVLVTCVVASLLGSEATSNIYPSPQMELITMAFPPTMTVLLWWILRRISPYMILPSTIGLGAFLSIHSWRNTMWLKLNSQWNREISRKD